MKEMQISIIVKLICPIEKLWIEDKTANYQVECYSELFVGIPTYYFVTLKEANHKVKLLQEKFEGKVHPQCKIPRDSRKVEEPIYFLCRCKTTDYVAEVV